VNVTDANVPSLVGGDRAQIDLGEVDRPDRGTEVELPGEGG